MSEGFFDRVLGKVDLTTILRYHMVKELMVQPRNVGGYMVERQKQI